MNDIAPITTRRPTAAALRRALRIAAMCADRSTMRSLVLLRILNKVLSIAGQDRQCSAHLVVDGNVDAPDGELQVAPGLLANLLGGLASELTLSIAHGKLTITDNGDTTMVLPGANPADDGPAVRDGDGGGYCTIPDAADLRRFISSFVFAIADDDNQYGLSGAHVELDAQRRLRAIATDGNRLFLASVAAEGVTGVWPTYRLPPDKKGAARRDQQALVSRRAWQVIAAALVGAEGPVELVWGDRSLLVACEDWSIRTRLLQAGFPDWRQVIPATFTHTLDADRDALLVALRRLAWAARSVGSPVAVRWTKGSMRLTASHVATDGRCSATVAVPAAFDGADDILLGVSAVFLRQALLALPPGPVRWEAGGPLAPMRLTSRVDDRGSWSILMPVRLD